MTYWLAAQCGVLCAAFGLSACNQEPASAPAAAAPAARPTTQPAATRPAAAAAETPALRTEPYTAEERHRLVERNAVYEGKQSTDDVEQFLSNRPGRPETRPHDDRAAPPFRNADYDGRQATEDADRILMNRPAKHVTPPLTRPADAGK